MVRWSDSLRRSEAAYRDRRLEMIAETSAFLSWALAQERNLPRIPCRRVDQGGFTTLRRHVGARALMERWWVAILSASWRHD